MSNIAYYIKKVYNKNDEIIPMNIFLTISTSDLMFFYTKLTDVDGNEYVDNLCLLKNYIIAKRIKNAMNRLAYHYKLKKAKHSIKYDMIFNSLDIINDNQKMELFSNNTIYYFRLSDIINIWVSCLTKCENMFCTPIMIKNPYTNIPFTKCNLYNIYHSIMNSGFQIPKWISFFYEAEFDINNYSYDNYTILKEVAIDDFMENGSVFEKFENIMNMMHAYRPFLNYIVLTIPLTFTEKKRIVDKLSHYLKNYLYGEYSCHPLKKKRSKNRAQRGLKHYFRHNIDISFYRETPLLPETNDLTSWGRPTALSSRISRILSLSRENADLSRRSPPSPPPPLSSTINLTVSEDTSSSLNILTTPTETTENTVVTTRPTMPPPRAPLSLNLNLNNRSPTNPFTPSFSLSRTPRRRRRRRPVDINSIAYNMGMFNRNSTSNNRNNNDNNTS